MKRIETLGIILLAVTLGACGENTVPTPPAPPSPPPPPLTTPVGANVGTPVTQTIGASGGAVTAGGVKLEVLPGTVTNANVTLQPITDTLNSSGQGVGISSDVSWSKYAKVSFPIDANDDDPASLGLAVQQSDGSWLSLDPVKVDTAAGTVTAGLPASVGSPGLRAQAGLKLTSVVKFKRFYLKPTSATVKTKSTKSFTAYAQVLQREQKDPNCGATTPDDLAPLCAFRQVTREYPFTNDKDGFARSWSVNGAFGGNGTVGTIKPSGSSGATYTAPDKKPNPDTVTVIFQSINTDSLDSVTLKASLKITDDVIQSYAGSVNFNGSSVGGASYSGQGNLTWTLIEHLPNDLSKYEASGSVQATANYPECTPATASVPVTGTMIVYDPVRGGPTDPFASKYWWAFTQGANVLATAQCGNPPKPAQVPVTFVANSTCSEAPTLPDAPKYADIALLTGSGSWACQIYSTTADWNFKAQ
jgi:hypothetical protein